MSKIYNSNMNQWNRRHSRIKALKCWRPWGCRKVEEVGWMWKEITTAAYVYVFIVKKIKDNVRKNRYETDNLKTGGPCWLYSSLEYKSSQVYTFKTWIIKGNFDSRFRQNMLKFLPYYIEKYVNVKSTSIKQK